MPCSSLRPGTGLSAGLLERKPGPGPPGGKGNAARIGASSRLSLRLPASLDVNKPGPQSETFPARCRAGSLPSAWEGVSGTGVGWRLGEVPPAPRPWDCVIGPGWGGLGPAPRGGCGGLARGPWRKARRWEVGGGGRGMGRLSSRPPGPPPGGQGEPRG